MRVYRRKNIYYVDYFLRGQRIRKRVGKSLAMAELALKELEVKRSKNELNEEVVLEKNTFGELAAKYMDYTRLHKSKTTQKSDSSIVIKLCKWFEGRKVNSITLQDAEKYKAERITKVSGSTVNREISCLKHMLNMAVQWQYLTQNPVKAVKKLKEPPGRLRFLDKKQISKLLKSCNGYLKAIVITALTTGMRKGEILNLKWSNVDLDKRLITITLTKNNELRILPINKLLYKTLKSLAKHTKSEYVFAHENGNPYNDIKKVYHIALKKAGITDFHFHDLRHTFASRLIMAGESLKTVQELLGHKDLKMTMRYSHLSTAHKQNAVEKLDFGAD